MAPTIADMIAMTIATSMRGMIATTGSGDGTSIIMIAMITGDGIAGKVI
jgi:hypothetical protein